MASILRPAHPSVPQEMLVWRTRRRVAHRLMVIFGAVLVGLTLAVVPRAIAGGGPAPLGSIGPSGEPTPTVPGPSPTVPGPSPTATPGSCFERLPLGEMEAQIPLVAGAEAVLEAGEALPGFAGVTIEVELCQIDVYWDGPLPPPVASVVESLRPTAIVISHTEPRHTHAELTAVAAELFDSPYRGEQAGVDVTLVSVRPEGTHVEVGVWPLTSVPPADPMQAAAQAQQLWSDLPVAVVAEPPAPTASRWDDSSPWAAGARHRVPGGGVCSTGWPMGTAAGSRYILTAAHCAQAPYGTAVRNGSGTRVIGTIEGFTAGIDAALIEVTAPGRVTALTWDGEVHDVVAPIGVNDDPESTAEIDDWDGTFVGQRLCTSGASTGEHCRIRVDANDVSYTNTLGWRVRMSARARQLDGRVAAGRGDSGGPAYSLTAGGTRVVAVGMIAALDPGMWNWYQVPCGGHPSTLCGSRFLYTRIGAVRINWGLSNVTRTGLS